MVLSNSKQEKDSELLRIVNVHCKDRTNHICAELPEDEHLEELLWEVNNLINDSKSKITSPKRRLVHLRRRLKRLREMLRLTDIAQRLWKKEWMKCDRF